MWGDSCRARARQSEERARLRIEQKPQTHLPRFCFCFFEESGVRPVFPLRFKEKNRKRVGPPTTSFRRSCSGAARAGASCTSRATSSSRAPITSRRSSSWTRQSPSPSAQSVVWTHRVKNHRDGASATWGRCKSIFDLLRLWIIKLPEGVACMTTPGCFGQIFNQRLIQGNSRGPGRLVANYQKL